MTVWTSVLWPWHLVSKLAELLCSFGFLPLALWRRSTEASDVQIDAASYSYVCSDMLALCATAPTSVIGVQHNTTTSSWVSHGKGAAVKPCTQRCRRLHLCGRGGE